MTILCGFVGTLTADAKKRTSQSGNDWTSLNLRAGHGEATQWVSVAVFGEDAAAAADLKEASAVFVEGRIELRRWEKHDGTKMSGLSVTASSCRPIDLQPKKPHSGRERASVYAPADDEINF
jgi:single-stranded DNA-binding protein